MNSGSVKGEVERTGLEQIAQELMQVTVVEAEIVSPETALMQIDPESSDLGTKAVQKHNRKMKKQLRSPKISRQPLGELSRNRNLSLPQGKRKLNLVDEDMMEVQVNEIAPKRHKLDPKEGNLSENSKGEGANLNWPLKLQ